jgi:hypothetical protein
VCHAHSMILLAWLRTDVHKSHLDTQPPSPEDDEDSVTDSVVPELATGDAPTSMNCVSPEGKRSKHTEAS